MARKPFLPHYKGASYDIGAKALDARPEFQRAIGRCLTLWPYVEHEMAVALGVFLSVESPAVTSVFTTLRTGRAQRDALNAAAEHILDPKMLRLFTAILAVVKSVEKQRADLAHGHWGIFRDIPDRIIWIESKHNAIFNSRALNGAWPREGHTYLHQNSFVLTSEDINEAYDNIERVWKLLFDFLTLHRDPLTKSSFSGFAGDELYEHLIQSPHVSEARSRLDRR